MFCYLCYVKKVAPKHSYVYLSFQIKIIIKQIRLFPFFSVLIKQGISAFEGNVYVLNKPVCDDGWSENEARVICKSLGCSSNTIAVPFKGDKFEPRFVNIVNCNFFGCWRVAKVLLPFQGGHVAQRLFNPDFILDDVKCEGHEKHIGACNYHTIHDCLSSKLAGVRCIDPQKLELRGGLLIYFQF